MHKCSGESVHMHNVLYMYTQREFHSRRKACTIVSLMCKKGTILLIADDEHVFSSVLAFQINRINLGPRREKTCLRGLQRGKTKTSLLSYRN